MDAERTWRALNLLEGDWNGFGKGGYPTITDFEYREDLRLRIVEDHGILHYLQSTWRIDGDEESGSHIETGFISVSDGGEILVLNAQGPDRVESLHGVLETFDGGLTLDLTGSEFLNDDRMLDSWRKVRCEADRLNYTMGMATTGAPGGELHLTAELHREAT